MAYRTIGIYVFLRTVMCSPLRASQIAHALKLPRVSVVRRLDELIKHGYVERVGNAYRVTDKVNIPDLRKKLQRRIDMVAETAKRLAEVEQAIVGETPNLAARLQGVAEPNSVVIAESTLSRARGRGKGALAAASPKKKRPLYGASSPVHGSRFQSSSHSCSP